MKSLAAWAAFLAVAACAPGAFAQGGAAGSPSNPSGDPTRPSERGPGPAGGITREPSPEGRVASDPQRPMSAEERAKCGQLGGTAQESCVRDLRARPGSGPAMGKGTAPGQPRSHN